jgi:hypothetical protein
MVEKRACELPDPAIAQLADELGLSRPSVHAHVGEMLASELLRESAASEKKYPAGALLRTQFSRHKR